MTSKRGSVYVLLKQGYIYIGSTTRLASTRLREHQRQSVERVYLLAYAYCNNPRQEERVLHAKYSQLRGGSDFFKLSETELENLIKTVNKLNEVNDK